MKATIVTIGDEILIKQIVDTNSACQIDRIGVEINEMISISDKSHIVDTLKNFKIPWIWLLSLVWVQLRMM
jgi:nicotinamide-nucleotide amidase